MGNSGLNKPGGKYQKPKKPLFPKPPQKGGKRGQPFGGAPPIIKNPPPQKKGRPPKKGGGFSGGAKRGPPPGGKGVLRP